MSSYLTATFYQFVRLADCAALETTLRELCRTSEVTGTVLLASEGINATICGEPAAVHQVLAWLRGDPRFARLEHKESFSSQRSLTKLKVRTKPEIITMGQPDIDPANQAGQYVDPEHWNALISAPDVVVIDTRNYYEVAIGKFEGAINPTTENFSDLPTWLTTPQAQESLGNKPKVAMYCTGGIRCEKSTALLRSQGFDQVFHLRGGILKYLETVPQEQSLWRGECFVFDDRVSVNHQLEPGQYQPCYGCGHPINAQNKLSDKYVPGKSCEHCFDQKQTQQQQTKQS